MPNRLREIEKSKEEFLARVFLSDANSNMRLDILTSYTSGASLRQLVNRSLTTNTGKPIQRY